MPDYAELRQALVDQLRASGALTQPEVEAAFLAVPRHLFLPDLPPDTVYQDQAIPVKHDPLTGRAISSSSQPAIMAIMLEQLEVAPGQRVLEIGAGTGYNAALLARLVGPQGHVVAVDIDADLAEAARSHLQAAGVGNVTVVCADGGYGYPAAAPFDRIIATAGAWDLPPAWIEQLRPGGRLVLPFTLVWSTQKSVAFARPAQPAPDGWLLESISVKDCGFMPLRGAFAGPDHFYPLGPEPGLSLVVAGLPAPSENIAAWLAEPGRDQRAGARIARRDIWQGLGFWLDLRARGFCTLTAEGDLAGSGRVPCLFRLSSAHALCMTVGLVAENGLCVLLPPTGAEDQPESAEFDLRLRTYGPSGTVAPALAAHIAAWAAAGRPSSAGMRVRVYPAGPVAAGIGGAGESGDGPIWVNKRWTRLAIDWPAHSA